MAAIMMALRLGVAVVTFAFVCHRIYRSLQPARNQCTGNVVNFDPNFITSCRLCLNEFDSIARNQIIVLPCRHKFHKCCIYEIIKNEMNQRICPLCRQEISEEFIMKSF